VKTVALALISAAALVASRSQGTPASALNRDDALVLRAVIEHTILPAVGRSMSGRNPATVVLVGDRSLPLCKNDPARDTPCRIHDHWRRFLVPDPARNWPGLIDNDRRRSELIDSLEARNALPHALPAIDHPAVVLVSADRSEQTQQQYREQTAGFSSLSLPGYSSDGHALMYGSYWCGNLCGYVWLFVLEKADGLWRVQSATILTIS
jgi:hypothetical protein